MTSKMYKSDQVKTRDNSEWLLYEILQDSDRILQDKHSSYMILVRKTFVLQNSYTISIHLTSVSQGNHSLCRKSGHEKFGNVWPDEKHDVVFLIV